MKTTILILCILCPTLTGCITNTGQYRGAANGVELRLQPDGTRVINVSGDAQVTIDQNNTLTATSHGNLQSLMDLSKALK